MSTSRVVKFRVEVATAPGRNIGAVHGAVGADTVTISLNGVNSSIAVTDIGELISALKYAYDEARATVKVSYGERGLEMADHG